MKRLALLLTFVFVLAFSAVAKAASDVSRVYELEFSGFEMPQKIQQNSTAETSVNFMNTGDAPVSNLKISFDLPGISTGGTVFVGQLGEGAVTTVPVALKATGATGKVTGSATVSFENGQGRVRSKTVALQTEIVKEKTNESSLNSSASAPRLMLIDNSLNCDYLSPDKTAELKITLKNYGSSALRNIKLAVSDESSQIKFPQAKAKYISSISAGATYVWSVELTASALATVGEKNITLSAEYEWGNAQSGLMNESISVKVNQTASLEFDGLRFPNYVYQKETVSLSVNLMNSGKALIKNCKLIFDVEGLESGGSVFVGDIPVGTSTSAGANLLVTAENTGEIRGTATVSFEDELGNIFTENVELMTTVKEPIPEKMPEEEDEPKYKFWYLFLIGGLVTGGAAGFAVPTIINAKKQQKEDELRL